MSLQCYGFTNVSPISLLLSTTLFDCPRVLKMCSNTYVLSSLEFCAPGWMLSVEFHLGLLDSIIRSAEILCESELCCLRRRNKVSSLCLLYNIYHRVDQLMNEYLDHFKAARNTRDLAALGELLPNRSIHSVQFCLLLCICETCCR